MSDINQVDATGTVQASAKDDLVEFTYPEGFKKAAATLTFLPEDQRERELAGIFRNLITA